MRQFTVPQFIDVEDKIIGPITVRQFIILIVAGLLLFLEYKLSDMVLFLILGVPTLAIFSLIAFFKVNGAPFHYFVLNVIATLKDPATRVWHRETKTFSAKSETPHQAVYAKPAARKPLSRSRLSELSLVIDTGGAYQEGLTEDSSFVNPQSPIINP